MHILLQQLTDMKWHNSKIKLRFLPRDASADRGDATVSRLSVCLSVRL